MHRLAAGMPPRRLPLLTAQKVGKNASPWDFGETKK